MTTDIKILATRLREESGARAVLLLNEADELWYVESGSRQLSELDARSIAAQARDVHQEPAEEDFVVAWHDEVALSFMYRKFQEGAFVIVFEHRSEIPVVREAVARVLLTAQSS